jgi:hypothetical protein
MKAINAKKQDRMEQIACDTRKAFYYDKSAGTWSWFDKSESNNMDAWHNGFESRFDALWDAVEPYMLFF